VLSIKVRAKQKQNVLSTAVSKLRWAMNTLAMSAAKVAAIGMSRAIKMEWPKTRIAPL